MGNDAFVVIMTFSFSPFARVQSANSLGLRFDSSHRVTLLNTVRIVYMTLAPASIALVYGDTS